MTDHSKHDQEAEENIKRIVSEYGWFVALFESTNYLPSFGYTIGLWKNYRHPEIILFGLKTKTIHSVLNDAGAVAKSGDKLLPNQKSSELFEGASAYVLDVHKENLSDYFGYGIWYNDGHFPAIQIAWPDSNGVFPWEQGFEEVYRFDQPLLDRNHSFKFREPKDLAVFTTRQHLELGSPILQVVHDIDGDWQFLTNDQMPDDARIVCLEDMIKRDPTLNQTFDLNYGEYAERDQVNGRWRRGSVDPYED